MFLNPMQSSRLMKTLCAPIAASLLLFAPGCHHDHCNTCSSCTSCASDSPSYRAYEVAPPPPVAYQPSAVQAPAVAYGAPGVRGPRSQAELDSIYNSTQVNPLPPPPPPRLMSLPQQPQESVVIVAPGEAAWSVPITREWKHIVIHHSASTSGNAASFDRAHREKGWDGLGYHFVIGNGSGSGDGQVEVGYRWTKQMQGAHAGNYEYNQHGIGICLVGDFEHGGPPSPAQMQSLRTLVAFLQAKANIAPNEIIGHGNVPGRNTECPGRHMDVISFRNSVGGAYIQRSSAPALIEKKEKTVKAAATLDSGPSEKAIAVKAVVTP